MILLSLWCIKQEWDVEKGLPRGVAAGLSNDDDDGRDRSSGGNPNTRNANNCCDNAGTEVVDGVHGKRQHQRVDGGDSKSTSGGGRSARGSVCAAVKVIVAVAAFTVTCAFVWYTMGLPFLLQVVVIATIAFVASGGYKLVYLVYRTAPRDLRSVDSSVIVYNIIVLS